MHKRMLNPITVLAAFFLFLVAAAPAFAAKTLTVTIAGAGTGCTVAVADSTDSSQNTTFTASGSVSLGNNDVGTITVTPGTGYQISSLQWGGAAVGTPSPPTASASSYSFSMGNSARTVSVTFALQTFAITASAGANGSISPAGTVNVNYNANQTFTFTPSATYMVDTVTVDGASQGGPASYTFSSVVAPHTISVTFKLRPQYVITASAGAGGSISPSGSVSVFDGANQTFTFTPAANYILSSVTVDGVAVAVAPSYTFFNVKTTHTIAAGFTRQYTITASAGANGSISPSGAVVVGSGASQTFTFTPAANYKIQNVVVDGVSQGAVTDWTFSAVAADHTISVSFVIKNQFTVTTEVWSWIPASGGYVANDTTGGTVAPVSATVYEGGSAAFTITPAAGYALRGIFLDDPNLNEQPAVSPFTLNNITANHKIYIRFRPIEHTITATAGGGGTISPSGAIATSQFGSYSFAVTPNTGFDIDYVMVCNTTAAPAVCSNRGAVSSVTINAPTVNYTVDAFFKGHNYTITSSTGAGGTITPLGSFSVPYGGSKSFAVTPNTGFSIQGVTVDGVNQGVVDSWTFDPVAANHTISATFVAKTPFTITATSGAGGAITPAAGAYTVYRGDSQTFTVTPNSGYAILNVVVDGVSQGPLATYAFNNVQANHTIAATFVTAYSIIATVGANGSITPAGTVAVISGANQTFTIAPYSGYNIQSVVIDGVAQVTPVSSYTFTNVTAGHTIHATFVSSGSTMNDYCNIPPFIPSDIKPNLLLMVDNSASMYDLAYMNTSTFCYDDGYDDNASYAGYFDLNSAPYYSYDLTNNKFDPATSIPAGCSFSTSYVCIDMSGVSPNRTVSRFVASGKFLNWLSASKLDVLKKALTGGKFDSTYNVLVGESRGCVGRRFIKAVPALPGITITVRGPGAFDPDFTNPVTQGGPSRIEIYDAVYNKDACLASVNDWQTGANMGSTQNDTKACVGAGTSTTKTSVYNHTIHDCYWFNEGHGLSNMNSLEGECESIYGDAALGYGNDPAKITNALGGDAICSSVLTHPPMTNNSSPNSSGYLGKCATLSGGRWSWNDSCATTEMMDYCTGVTSSGVTDPSTSAYVAGTTANVPAFVMDSGVNALGRIAGTFYVKLALPAAPSGAIDVFRSMINFGLMTFNVDGAASELESAHAGTKIIQLKACSNNAARQCYLDTDCQSGGTCGTATIRDGSYIRSYISHPDFPVGDHDSGLINKIDAIQATSWTPFAESFYNAIGYFAQRSDKRLNSGDFIIDAAHNPSKYTCQKNNVLIVTDGMSTADRHPDVVALANLYKSASNQTTTSATAWNAAPANAGSLNLDDLASLAKNRSILDFTKTTGLKDNEYITTHVVYTGAACPAKDGNGVCTSTDETVPEVEMQHTASYGGGLYLRAEQVDLQDRLMTVFKKVAVAASSGTAASILSNSEGSGANILQAVFYPKKSFDDGRSNVNWIGELQNLWYYVDPFISNSSVRENTADPVDAAANTLYLNLKSDYEARFKFNTAKNETEVELWEDTNGDGLGDTGHGTISADLVKSLWRGGKKLWLRSADRTIYTQTAGSVTNFSLLDTTSAAVRGLIQATDQAEADRIINYVEGVDHPSYRDRSIAIPSPVGPDNTERVWKLGDIISSTPRVQSGIKLNNFNLPPPAGYNDLTYGNDGNKTDGFIYQNSYKNRGMAYVGANDGMLHAFKLGKLSVTAADDKKATLSGTRLGDEEWAFVPKNALPYLKYLADKDYTHLYYVDGSTIIADVSTGKPTGCGGNYWDCSRKDADGNWRTDGSNWRTVLIGAMGAGGASRNSTTVGTGNFVKTPIADVGYSSYFALDITDQTYDTGGNLVYDQTTATKSPLFLWEFSNEALGYSTSGPAIVKIKATNIAGDDGKNGRWFAVFASGPTGPIDGNVCQFKGKSDQNLKLFIVDLMSGELLHTINTTIPYAFAGVITNGVIDSDRWDKSSTGYYQDDAVYIGYVRNTSSDGTGTWTQGGVGRLITHENIDPTTWTWSKVIDGIGSVTTNVAKLQDRKNHNLWLYFGTGRYFFGDDDKSSARRIFGIKEPCYKEVVTHADSTVSKEDIDDNSCTTELSVLTDLTPQTTSSKDSLGTLLGGTKGWYIDLDGEDTTNNFGAERVITDPVAMINGAVFFTTFLPTTDACAFGGKSYIWATKYDTGFQAPTAALKGKALVQVSTGSFEQIDLSTAFTEKEKRRMGSSMTGKPPTDPPPIVSTSGLKPVKKILHIMER